MNDFVIENKMLIKYVGENEDVVVPQGITTIGALSFVGRPIKSVSIPEGVVAIGDNAFYECVHLANVVIPKSVKHIERQAFGYCRSLEKVIIPEGVRFIGDEAFIGCSKLSSVTMRYGTIELASRCFVGCASLTSFSTIGSTVISRNFPPGDSLFTALPITPFFLLSSNISPLNR